MYQNNTKKSTLGCYLIVKNEEDKITGCLRCLSRVCDEIVVVDTGSKDKTVEYASKFARIEHFTWVNDFSAARNYAKSLMTTDYIFSIDADEYLTSALIEKLNLLKQENFKGYNSINMFIELDQNRFYLGGRQIVKNVPEVTWKYKVHEKLYYDESNDLLLDGPNEYIIHRPKSSTSNYNKYAEIYYNEINKGDILNDYNTAHYFYYLFFTLKDIDPFMAKRYLYNCFILDKIKSNTENQGFNLWDCNWISNDDYYVNSLIGGYQNPKMIMRYVNNKTTDDIAKYVGLRWCYDHEGVFSEIDYINLAFISYQYGLFKDFIKITTELNEKYPDSEIGNNNMSFIQNTLCNLNNYNLIIDCSNGANCLPSALNLISQYYDKIYIKIDDIKNLPQNLGNCENLDEIQIIYDEDEISNNKRNIFILGNHQYDRIFLKNIMQNIVYNKEPNEKIVYVK